eukprot:3599251-Pleurochrysis_carterae.AAC.3
MFNTELINSMRALHVSALGFPHSNLPHTATPLLKSPHPERFQSRASACRGSDDPTPTHASSQASR